MKRKTKSLFLIVCAVFMVLCTGISAMAANGEYYATWDEYLAGTGLSGEGWNAKSDAIDLVIQAGEELFEAGDYTGAYDAITTAYYGYYETTGFERNTMASISGAEKSAVELQFKAAKKVAKNEGSYEDFCAEAQTLSDMIRQDACTLDDLFGYSYTKADDSSDESSSSSSGSAAAATFVACYSILLREGFEAILIVGAIIAYLNKAGAEDEKRRKKMVYPVYLGSLLGIAMSFVLAWLLSLLKLANSASQEVIEGVTALTAVVVLYYVSNWMLSKSESDAWQNYIKKTAKKGSENGSIFALAGTAFLAVFREGAEVVLFFQPYFNGDNTSSVVAGFILGAISLVFVYLLIKFMGLRIPLKPFFTATSVLMFIMSISFLGGGIKELIEGDVVSMTTPAWLEWIPTNDFLDVLGIYGCLETLIPQLILIIVTVIIFLKTTKKNQLIHAEAEAKRQAEEAIRLAEEKAQEEASLRALIREVVLEVLNGDNRTSAAEEKATKAVLEEVSESAAASED